MNKEIKKANEKIDERFEMSDKRKEELSEKVSSILAILKNSTTDPADSLISERLVN